LKKGWTGLQVWTWVTTLLLLSVHVLKGQAPDFRVQVLDSRHHPVNAASVELIFEQQSQTAMTDLDGFATFANLPTGKYRVRVNAYSFREWIRDQDIADKQQPPLLVTLRQSSLGCEPRYWIDYDNKPGPQVRGQITNIETGKSIRGIRIDLYRSGEKKPFVTTRSGKKSLSLLLTAHHNRSEPIQALLGTHSEMLTPALHQIA
jgi:hypothetical protein